jgi:hypothetical protein
MDSTLQQELPIAAARTPELDHHYPQLSDYLSGSITSSAHHLPVEMTVDISSNTETHTNSYIQRPVSPETTVTSTGARMGTNSN